MFGLTHYFQSSNMYLLGLANQVFTVWFVVGAGYLFLGFLYLILIPLFLFYWMNNRWNIMGKFERLIIYGLVFVFFPGLVLFAPFLNLRINGQGEV